MLEQYLISFSMDLGEKSSWLTTNAPFLKIIYQIFVSSWMISFCMVYIYHLPRSLILHFKLYVER